MPLATEPSLDEATLIRAAQDGDRLAFGQLYENYRRLVHGILLSYVCPDEAEDLMQDVFLKAMNSLSHLREPAAFPAWLIAITRHIALDLRRSEKSTYRPADFHAGTIQSEEEALSVLKLIQNLPASYRETLVLRLVEGMTGPEISNRTGLTPNSVRVNLCRGMKLLRARLKGISKR